MVQLTYKFGHVTRLIRGLNEYIKYFTVRETK